MREQPPRPGTTLLHAEGEEGLPVMFCCHVTAVRTCHLVPRLLSCTWFHGHLPLATRRAGRGLQMEAWSTWVGRAGAGDPGREMGKDGGREGRSLKQCRVSTARKQLGCRDKQLEGTAVFTPRPPPEAGQVSPQAHDKIKETCGL